jgi:hypothetical protein
MSVVNRVTYTRHQIANLLEGLSLLVTLLPPGFEPIDYQSQQRAKHRTENHEPHVAHVGHPISDATAPGAVVNPPVGMVAGALAHLASPTKELY